MVKKQFNAEPLHRLKFSTVQLFGRLRYAVYKRMQEDPGMHRQTVFRFRDQIIKRFAL